MDDDRTQRNESKMNPNLWALLQTEQTLEELPTPRLGRGVFTSRWR